MQADMQVEVCWKGEVKFLGHSGSGHDVWMDGPPDHGGRNQGVRPMEMLLLGVGGCSSYDVVQILKKSRQAVTGCQAVVQAKRANTVPAVFTEIHLHFKVQGQSLDECKVRRAVDLSAEKYCSASIMLARAGVNITHSFEILP